MTNTAPRRDPSAPVYIGVAPVFKGPGGSLRFNRSDVRIAPEFGAQEIDMSWRTPYQHMPGALPLQDPTGMTPYPGDETYAERWAFASDELTVDNGMALDGDVDIYDSPNVPDDYQMMIAGSEFGRRGLSGGPQRSLGSRYAQQGFMRVPQQSQRQQRSPQQYQQAAPSSDEDKWQKTAIVGANAVLLTVAGPYAFQLRPQHDFVAMDMTMDGSPANSTLETVVFGDYTVLNNQPGIPIAVLGVAGFIRGIVKGARIRAGLDITVTGQAGGGGTPVATFFGLKPQTNCNV